MSVVRYGDCPAVSSADPSEFGLPAAVAGLRLSDQVELKRVGERDLPRKHDRANLQWSVVGISVFLPKECFWRSIRADDSWRRGIEVDLNGPASQRSAA